MQRMGLVTRYKADTIAEYKRIHAAVWPEVLETITECDIRKFSIYLQRAGKPDVRLLRV